MDRAIEQKTGWKKFFSKKFVPYYIGAAALAAITYAVVNTDASALTASGDAFKTGTATYGEFADYIRLNGQVQPMTTIQISPLEGGVVEEIVNEEGANLKAGDIILRLSNDNLDLQILNSEAELAEKENILRNTMISMQQQKLDLEQNRLKYTLVVRRTKRAYEQKKALYDDQLCSKEEFTTAQEDYELAKAQLDLVIERSKQDSIYRSVQVAQMTESLDNMRRYMQIIRHRKENLTIRASIDGELGLLDAVRGQNIMAGVKIGQINSLDNFKIEAQIDEHYIDRVTPGLTASFEKNDGTFSAIIRKVYPEVRNGKFRADFKFEGQTPDNIRTGQTYYLNLQLGQPTDAIIISKGTFFQKTGGSWIYVMDKSGKFATKRSIKIGRQNPKYYEIIDGLEPGEQVIISGYELFSDSDKLIIEK